MYSEIPFYGLRAYALFYSRHGTNEEFTQSDLDWIVRKSMKKKIFSLLLNSGWIRKINRSTYQCVNPEEVFKGLLEFKVPEIIKESTKPYAFTGLSAIEAWSDYSYVQRSREKSPYYVKVLKKDLKYWKAFFNKKRIPNYVREGATIGEFVILVPVEKMTPTNKEGVMVDDLQETMKAAKSNTTYDYPYNYMKEKYGSTIA
jgi:hypothetical protein